MLLVSRYKLPVEGDGEAEVKLSEEDFNLLERDETGLAPVEVRSE